MFDDPGCLKLPFVDTPTHRLSRRDVPFFGKFYLSAFLSSFYMVVQMNSCNFEFSLLTSAH